LESIIFYFLVNGNGVDVSLQKNRKHQSKNQRIFFFFINAIFNFTVKYAATETDMAAVWKMANVINYGRIMLKYIFLSNDTKECE